MKSHITWLVEGDKNTSFYHTLALVCRRRNRISCLKESVGNWIQGEGEIAIILEKGTQTFFLLVITMLSRLLGILPFGTIVLMRLR